MTLKIEKIDKIWELHRKGASITENAEITGHDRHTVQKAIDRGEPTTGGREVSVKELETMNNGREKVKDMLPDLAAALKQNPDLRASAAKQGLYVLTKEEWKYISAVNAMDMLPGAGNGEKIKMITGVVRYIYNTYGGDEQGVSADELHSLTQGTMDLWTELTNRGIGKEKIHAFLDSLIYLEQAGLEEQDYNGLGAFVLSCREHGVDLAGFLRKYHMGNVSNILAEFSEFLTMEKSLEKSVGELRQEEHILAERIGKYRTIQQLNHRILQLSDEIEGLHRERDKIKEEVENLQTIMKATLTLAHLASELKEKQEEKERLDSEISDRKQVLGEIEAKISGLQPRYEYMESGSFANDLLVQMFRKAFGTNGNPEHGFPEAIWKYESLKPQFHGYGKDGNPYQS